MEAAGESRDPLASLWEGPALGGGVQPRLFGQCMMPERLGLVPVGKVAAQAAVPVPTRQT